MRGAQTKPLFAFAVFQISLVQDNQNIDVAYFWGGLFGGGMSSYLQHNVDQSTYGHWHTFDAVFILFSYSGGPSLGLDIGLPTRGKTE